MSETINLPTLISRLATATATDPADVRRYLHHLFATIEQTLKTDGRVTVPGIGEFVASGDASSPIIFKADDQLAAVANEPFAAFTAVELNDGVTESILDETSTPEPAPEPEPVYQPEPQPQPIYEPEPEPEPEPQPEPEPEPEPQPEPQSEPEPIIEEDEAEEPEYEEPVNEEPEYQEPEYNYAEPQQSNEGHGLWIVLGLLIGLLIGLIGGFFAGKKWGASYADVDIVANSIEVNPVDEDDTEIIKPLPAIEENTEAQAAEIATEPAKPIETAKPQATPEPVYDTISSTRYLTTMARDHYGKKNYWVFIYQANPQLKNPNTISPGTRIVIPAYESFAGATPEETDAKARQLLNQLSTKYNL